MKKLVCAALALAFTASPLLAQRHVSVSPFYGYIFPQGSLPATFALTRVDASTIDIKDGEFESRTPFYGATVGIQLFKGLSIEGTVVRGTDELTATRREPADVDILAYSGGLELALPSYGRLQPFLLAGAGVKSYDFDIADTKQVRDFEMNFGAGLNLKVVDNVAITVQARDFVSTFSSSLFDVPNEKQNDLLFAGGLTFSFGLGGHRAAAAIKH